MTRKNIMLNKIAIIMTFVNFAIMTTSKKLNGQHVYLIDQKEEEKFIKEHQQRPIMKIYEETDQEFLKTITKSFELYFDIYQINDGEKLNQILIYPLGNYEQKQKNKKVFDISHSPKNIANYLLSLNENRIMPLKMKNLQNSIQNSIVNLKKLPIILLEEKEEKNRLINFRTLPYIKEFSDRFEFYYMDEELEIFHQQFQLQKYPAVISFQMQEAEQGKIQLAGVPFQKALSFKNLVQFLHYMSREADSLDPERQQQSDKEQKIELDTSINLFTTNNDPNLSNCQNKLCVLVFTQQYFQTQQQIEQLKQQLEEVQGFFNKQSTEVYLLDAGCNQQILPMFNLSWDFLPNLVIYQKKQNKFFNMQELFTTDGMKRAIIKAQKNMTQSQMLTEELKIRTENCEEVNQILKQKIEQMNQTTQNEDDEILKEVIRESQKKETEKFVQKKSKKERRQERLRRRKEREQKIEELQLIKYYTFLDL